MQDNSVITLREIEQLSESRVIVIIDGGIYDVTEFINIHPGGRELLLKFNRKDASKAFHATSHSIEAKKMLAKYCMGILVGSEEQFQNSVATSLQDDTFLNTAIKKLITHEDKFHIHKILGTLVISHFFVRVLLLLIGTIVYLWSGNREIFLLNISLDPVWLLVAMALAHGLLSLSGLQFYIPKKSNQSKPMMHRLFRGHSIAFSLRAVACMFVYVLLQDDIALRNFILSLIILSTLIAADIITKKLTVSEDRFDTTASMPYWFGISLLRQKTHKFLYGYAQFLATFVCLAGGYAGALYTLAPIQGAAFGMTLVRKNILSARVYHNIYLLLLFLPIPFAVFLFPIKVMGTLLLTLIMFYLRTLGVSKYVLWLPVLVMCNLLLVPQENWKIFITGLMFFSMISVAVNLLFVKLRREQRIDKNNRIIDRKEITEDSFEIIIRTKMPMNILSGQHVFIRLNDELERKYSPIWIRHLSESDQTLLCLRIKKYTSVDKQTASEFLATCTLNTVLDLHGPIGEKYFCRQEGVFVDRLSEHFFDPQDYNVYLFSAGSGITPIFRLAESLCVNANIFTLVTCDKSPDHLMMKNEIGDLKAQFSNLLHWVSIFSSYKGAFQQADVIENERLMPETIQRLIEANTRSKNDKPDLIIVCGPDVWQKMICASIEALRERKSQVLVW